jgi:NADH-dependent peroxiredoxin subunit C
MENTTINLESSLENLSLQIYNPKTDKIETKTIYDYKDKRIIFVFYPADFTFVCPTELKDLNKIY